MIIKIKTAIGLEKTLDITNVKLIYYKPQDWIDPKTELPIRVFLDDAKKDKNWVYVSIDEKWEREIIDWMIENWKLIIIY